jgi:hypothetical protein
MIKKTTEQNKHNHMAYIKPDGTGVTSEDNGHVHELKQVMEFVTQRIIGPDGQPVIDPNTGLEALEEVQQPKLDENGEPVFEMSEVDGHTHDLVDVEIIDRKKQQDSEEDRVAETIRLYDVAKRYDSDYRVQAGESEDFYLNDQWDQSIISKLKSEDRAHYTVNEIKPKIDLLSGYQRQNRTELRYFPTEDGDQEIADILTKLAKNITEQSNYPYEETNVFEDEIITGRGNLHVFVDVEDNLDSDIKIEKFNWKDVVYGPHDKLDGSDCEYVVKQKWFSKEKIKALYPNKADKIEASFNFFDILNGNSSSFDDDYSSGKILELKDTLMSNMQDIVDLENKNIRVFELLKKEYKRVPIAFNKFDNFYVNAEGLSSEDLEQLKNIEGLAVVMKVFSNVVGYRVAGSVLLDSSESIFSRLPIIPVYATKKGKTVFGKVHVAKGLQQEINKRHCQMSDFANKMYNAGWLYEKGAFLGNQKSKFKKAVAKPGFVEEVENLSKIQKLEGMKFPSELVALHSDSSNKLTELMGINASLLGSTSGNVPAIAQAEQKRQALIGNEYLFDNLSLSKKVLGKLILEAIRAVYTPQRVFRILNNQSSVSAEDQLTNPNTQQPYTLEDIIDIWINADLSRYDVVVGENMYNLTNRQSNFAIWSNLLVQSQLPPSTFIPFLLELSDVPGKDDFLQSINQQQAQQQQEVDTTAQLQVEMSQPDDVKRMKLGLPPEGLTNEQAFLGGQANEQGPAL